jgi:hypothetical protein
LGDQRLNGMITTNSVGPEAEDSSLRSQEPATGPIPVPTTSTPHSPPPPGDLPGLFSEPILPSTRRSSDCSLSSGLSHQNLVHFSLLSHACHMPYTPQYPWLLAKHFGYRETSISTALKQSCATLSKQSVVAGFMHRDEHRSYPIGPTWLFNGGCVHRNEGFSWAVRAMSVWSVRSLQVMPGWTQNDGELVVVQLEYHRWMRTQYRQFYTITKRQRTNRK